MKLPTPPTSQMEVCNLAVEYLSCDQLGLMSSSHSKFSQIDVYIIPTITFPCVFSVSMIPINKSWILKIIQFLYFVFVPFLCLYYWLHGHFLLLKTMVMIKDNRPISNSTVHLFHIPQCTIHNRNVHISVLNDALCNMGQMHCGICEFGIFYEQQN